MVFFKINVAIVFHMLNGDPKRSTYALLLGAVFLEIYAVISLIFSNWTMRWITKKRTLLRNILYCVISSFGSILPRKKRWSESMAQHNLVKFCLKPRFRRCSQINFFFRIYFTLELYWQRKWEDVDADLKRLIFGHYLSKHQAYNDSGFDYDELKSLLAYKGDFVLQKNNCLDEIGWSVEFEFDHSLLIWHVATDICFHSDPKNEQDPNCQASRKISNYMFYVLLMRPIMLPRWIDRFTYVQDTYREATGILHREEFRVKGIADACDMMLQLRTQCQSLELVRREKSGKSVLLDACRLAEQLHLLNDPLEMICQVWIEMLTYAASHCEWDAHAQQLRRGGELLTRVSLLMADLGLSEQFDIGRRGSKIESQNVGWGWEKLKSSSYTLSAFNLEVNNE